MQIANKYHLIFILSSINTEIVHLLLDNTIFHPWTFLLCNSIFFFYKLIAIIERKIFFSMGLFSQTNFYSNNYLYYKYLII